MKKGKKPKKRGENLFLRQTLSIARPHKEMSVAQIKFGNAEFVLKSLPRYLMMPTFLYWAHLIGPGHQDIRPYMK